MSTLDISDTQENNSPNITVNVEDVSIDQPEDEPEVEADEPEVEADEPEDEPEPVDQPENEPEDFDEYLKSIGLEKFTNKFKENGYNSVESLKKINISDIKNISKNIKEFKCINRRL